MLLCVRAFVRPGVSVISDKQLDEFHQTLFADVVEDTDESRQGQIFE